MKEQKNLNILSGIYSPFDRFNGSVVFCYNLYEEMIKNNCVVDFVGLKTPDVIDTNMNLHLLDGELTGQADTPDFNKAVEELKKVFSGIIKNKPVDVIHGHHLTFPPAAAFAALKPEQPLVITSHASDIEFAENHPAHAEHMRRSLDIADKVVLLSRKLIPLLEKIKPDMDINKVAVIPLGVDEKFFSKEKPVKDDEKFTILYAGRLTKEKGVGILLDALVELPKAVLRIAGKGTYKEELEEKIKSLNLEDRVEFLGFLGREELKKEYQKASILAVPSQGIEGIPQVCLEAMANYLPVVATDSGGTAEFFTDAAIIVPKGKPEKIVETIVRLYKEPSLREEYSLIGREKVKEFSWAKIAKLYSALFRSLL